MRNLLVMAAMLAAPAAAADTPSLPGWMAGCWEQRAGERWTEECWTTARGGIMLGSSRTGTGDRVTEWEAMQIVRGDTLTFWASPNGAGRTAFASGPDAGAGVTFHNAANDYPQRIRYWREGELLKAEIALRDGSKPMTWIFRRIG